MSGSRFLRVIVAGLIAATAAGCTTIGEREFACPGRPEGVRCLSATGVYQATEGTAIVLPTASKAVGDNPGAVERSQNRRRPKEHGNSGRSDAPRVAPQPPSALLPTVDKPVPIRTPSQVIRVWVAPWEDKQGILRAGGYSFIEIESRRWAFGDSAYATEPARLFSIQSAITPAVPQSGVEKRPSPPPATSPRAGTNERSPNTASSAHSGVSK